MKSALLLFLLTFQHSFAYQRDAESIRKLMKLDIASIRLGSLFSESVLVPKSIEPPSFMQPQTVHFWMVGCTGCIGEMKKEWKTKNQIWINLDENFDDLQKAKNFLIQEKIGIVPYHDKNGEFRRQIGRKFALPITLKVQNGKVLSVF